MNQQEVLSTLDIQISTSASDARLVSKKRKVVEIADILFENVSDNSLTEKKTVVKNTSSNDSISKNTVATEKKTRPAKLIDIVKHYSDKRKNEYRDSKREIQKLTNSLACEISMSFKKEIISALEEYYREGKTTPYSKFKYCIKFDRLNDNPNVKLDVISHKVETIILSDNFFSELNISVEFPTLDNSGYYMSAKGKKYISKNSENTVLFIISW